MRTQLPALLTLGVGVLVLAVGCTQPRAWEDKTKDEPQPEGQLTVLFAPVDAGPVIEVNPDAPIGFARDMSLRLGVLARRVQVWVGQTLPASNEAVWEAGPVGAAAGADLVVLTEVRDLQLQPGPVGRPGTFVANVRMRGFNSAGQLVWMKQMEGRSVNEVSPKMMRPGARPESKAAWSACLEGLVALNHYLKTWNEAPQQVDHEPEALPLIDVSFDSIPPNADIIIDGLFRGNTPAVVPLPVRELTVRIQRQGYQPWEMQVTPSSSMRIQPALTPLVADEDEPSAPE